MEKVFIQIIHCRPNQRNGLIRLKPVFLHHSRDFASSGYIGCRTPAYIKRAGLEHLMRSVAAFKNSDNRKRHSFIFDKINPYRNRRITAVIYDLLYLFLAEPPRIHSNYSFCLILNTIKNISPSAPRVSNGNNIFSYFLFSLSVFRRRICLKSSFGPSSLLKNCFILSASIILSSFILLRMVTDRNKAASPPLVPTVRIFPSRPGYTVLLRFQDL